MREAGAPLGKLACSVWQVLLVRVVAASATARGLAGGGAAVALRRVRRENPCCSQAGRPGGVWRSAKKTRRASRPEGTPLLDGTASPRRAALPA